jgi:hypothetical protein
MVRHLHEVSGIVDQGATNENRVYEVRRHLEVGETVIYRIFVRLYQEIRYVKLLRMSASPTIKMAQSYLILVRIECIIRDSVLGSFACMRSHGQCWL